MSNQTNEFDLALETFNLMSKRLNFDERIVEEITNLQILIRSNRETYIIHLRDVNNNLLALKTEIVTLKEIVDKIRFLLKDVATI